MDWTADKLTELATGYWQSAALIGAVELGLFDHLDEETTPGALAERCGARAELLISLLDALVSMQLLTRRESFYRIAPGARALLSRSSNACLLDALRYNVDLYRQWGKLAEVMRTGTPAIEQKRQLGLDPALTRRFVYGMESKARAFIPAIVPLIRLNGETTLLDVGSGPGTLSRALAEINPGLSVTLLDLPEILNIAKEICAPTAAAARLRYHPANYRVDALPGSFDAILYAGALHQESPDSAQSLLRRFHDALAPGGRVFIVDLMLDDDRTSPQFSSLFQITMLLMRPSARVFSRREIAGLLERAGFDSILAQEPASSPYRIVTARKPENR